MNILNIKDILNLEEEEKNNLEKHLCFYPNSNTIVNCFYNLEDSIFVSNLQKILSLFFPFNYVVNVIFVNSKCMEINFKPKEIGIMHANLAFKHQKNFGTIFFCHTFAKQNFNNNLQFENFLSISFCHLFMYKCHLFIHSLLHLLGYNHTSYKEKKSMFKQETRIIRRIFNEFFVYSFLNGEKI